MSIKLSQRLHEHGDPHGHTLLEYPEASHSLGYLIPHLPAGLLPPQITDAAADKAGGFARPAGSAPHHPPGRNQ